MDEEVGNNILTPDRDSGDTGVSGIFVVVVSKLQPRSQQVGQRRGGITHAKKVSHPLSNSHSGRIHSGDFATLGSRLHAGFCESQERIPN